jgi:phospholipid/cholesterol/gamma-HCH transport system ATP-binding protein
MNTTQKQDSDSVSNSNERETILEIRNLKKAFGKLEVLKDISLDLYKGENLVVLGKSGTGKSVLIKCIVRLLESDSGTITVLDQSVSSLERKQLRELRQKIGFLFQSGALYDSMSVKQNLEFAIRRIRKEMSEQDITEKVNEVLLNVGLSDALHKMPSELSGGMRKRISLARTIIVDPLILLYDEPTTGLDPVTSNEISNLINLVKEKYKTSSIIITHDIECARTTADRIIMLKDGSVHTEGTIEEFENSPDPVINSFFNKQIH